MRASLRSCLTPRQADIARMLQEKRSNKVIGKALGQHHHTAQLAPPAAKCTGTD